MTDRPAPGGRSRRRPLVLTLAVVAVVVAGTWAALGGGPRDAAEGPPPTPATPPDLDVVVYVIDTLRADRLGLHGYSRPTSPFLEQLAAESVVFENAAAPAPWTLPSITSLLTSTFPCEHGVNHKGVRVSQSLRTLGERMQEAGFRTVSLFANQYAGPVSGLERGHDRWRHMDMEERQHPQRLVQEVLAETGGAPLYLYVHTLEPHDPYRAPRRLVEMFGEVSEQRRQEINRLHFTYRRLTNVDFREKRPVGTTDNTGEQEEALAALASAAADIDVLYDACVRQADENLRRVVETLRRSGRWDRTLLVVLSDHGEELGERGGFQHDQSLYEELVHVPLVVRFPGGEHGGRRVEEPVTLLDVLPTILAVAGRPDLARPARGRSLVPVAAGGGGGPTDLQVVSVRVNEQKHFRPWHDARGDRNVAVRRGPLKGVWNVDLRTFELYDTHRDPGETVELSGEYAALSRSMLRHAMPWWEACLSGSTDLVPAPDVELPDDALEELRALGYVQ